MKQGMLLYWYRGGSTLIQSVLHGEATYPVVEGWQSGPNCCYLENTNPPKICVFDYSLNLQSSVLPPFDYCVWRAHMGDGPGNEEHKKCIALMNDDSKIIMLCRDGRNQIASHMRINPHEESYKVRNTLESFERYCFGFHYRVEFIRYLREHLNNRFKLIKFEDLLISPLEVVSSIYDFWGISLDKSRLVENISHVGKKPNEPLAHSSFGTIENVNIRWHNWTEDQKVMFNKIAGKSLSYLEYE